MLFVEIRKKLTNHPSSCSFLPSQTNYNSFNSSTAPWKTLAHSQSTLTTLKCKCSAMERYSEASEDISFLTELTQPHLNFLTLWPCEMGFASWLIKSSLGQTQFSEGRA